MAEDEEPGFSAQLIPMSGSPVPIRHYLPFLTVLLDVQAYPATIRVK
jgi:hypothetical protein